MGYYTQFVMGARFKAGHDDVRHLMRTLLDPDNSRDEPPNSPSAHLDHPWFKTDRWFWMFHGTSAYFAGDPCSRLVSDYDGEFSIRCNIKNYTEEIEHFADFIAPFVEDRPEWSGYKMGEDDEYPTLLRFKEGRAVWVEVTAREESSR